MCPIILLRLSVVCGRFLVFFSHGVATYKLTCILRNMFLASNTVGRFLRLQSESRQAGYGRLGYSGVCLLAAVIGQLMGCTPVQISFKN